MISTITSASLTQSFANRDVIPSANRNQNSQMRYFNNLEMKLNPNKKLEESKDSFEFAFDDMF